MKDLLRLEVKYIRDSVKANYRKDSNCYICNTTELLEFHHRVTLTLLWNKWKRDNSIKINDVDDILKYRDIFSQEHQEELLVKCITLCKTHHAKLHKVYGKSPALSTVEKQLRWCDKQRDKEL